MAAAIDHLIVHVNDVEASVAFYQRVLGFRAEGRDGPFSVVRVSPDFTLQLAPWGTKGAEHLAFALSKAEFENVFARIREEGLRYGASFDTVGSQTGPGEENGARGPAPTLYFFDPSEHLLEIRHYAP